MCRGVLAGRSLWLRSFIQAIGMLKQPELHAFAEAGLNDFTGISLCVREVTGAEMAAVAKAAAASASNAAADSSARKNAHFMVNETYFELGSKVLEAECNKAFIMDPVTQLSDHAPSLRAHKASQRQPVVVVTSPEDRAVFESRRSLLLETASEHSSQAYRSALKQVSSPWEVQCTLPHPPVFAVAEWAKSASARQATC